MKKIKFIIVLSILLTIIFACNNIEKEIKKEISKPQTPQTISGNGDDVKKVDLNKGVAIFDATYNGYRNFIVRLKRDDGKEYPSLFNQISETGKYKGSTSFTVPADGVYILTIKSYGNWVINVK